MTKTRVPWDEYFMRQCDLIATRATCNRKHVGAVIVLDNRILATGYNGSLPGLPHCDDIGHMMEDGHCVRTVHAEVNAVAQAAKAGVRLDGAVLYCNTFPCWNCFKVIVSAGIIGIVYDDEYSMVAKDQIAEAVAQFPARLCFFVRKLSREAGRMSESQP